MTTGARRRRLPALLPLLAAPLGGLAAPLKVPQALRGSAAALAASGAGRLELDLANLAFRGASSGRAGWPVTELMNATLPGGAEVACLNCDPSLFAAWVGELAGRSGAPCLGQGAPSAPLHGGAHGKHPNAPGYDRWHAKEGHRSEGASVLQAPVLKASHNACAVATTYLQHHDLEASKPRLQRLWAERRLIVGMGANPVHQQMDFFGVLVTLGRAAPHVARRGCYMRDGPPCGAFMRGHELVASAEELRAALRGAFGAAFLEANRFDPRQSTAEQWSRVRTLLSALKHSFVFYRGGCLGQHSAADSGCEQKPAELVGRFACSPDVDDLSHGCVYAELRRCTACGGQPNFFEYARFHGPLALFGTRRNRGWVMGQCEEFSRAGYALLASLGYEARYVLDFTDHVWIEVKLPRATNSTADWVHADPSEGVLDSPLMYERGWGKKLTMIFAFTPSSVEHVTRTYTEDYAGTVARRGIGDEVLGAALEEANRRLRYELPRQSWGYASQWLSKDRTLEEVSLWSHFEAH